MVFSFRHWPLKFLLVALLLTPAAHDARAAQDIQVALAEPHPAKSAGAATGEKLTARDKLERAAAYRRIIWVTRWDYKTADDIKKICYNAASARFTDVLFQVRGEGTVFFKSKVEPWAWELTSDSPRTTGRDPGWDPLAVAVREGHRYGLKVHAYMNVLPGWAQSSEPPERAHQMITEHRNWFMVTRGGYRMDPARWYAFVDPGLPAVRAHLAAVYREVARNYNIDGIHLDYIRYPEEQGDFSYNPQVLKAFKAETGKDYDDAPDQWRSFRREQITQCVREISKAVRGEKPKLEISAAVIADTKRRENECYQPAKDWVRLGLVDYVAPMAYTGDNDTFATYCDTFADNALRKHVWMGVTADPNLSSQVNRQINRAAARGFGGVAVFAYENLFRDHEALPRARGVYETFVSSKKVTGKS